MSNDPTLVQTEEEGNPCALWWCHHVLHVALPFFPLTGDLWHSNPCRKECAEMSFPVRMMNPGVVSSPGRTVLHAVGVACVLGFTTSLTNLHGLGAKQEIIPFGFRSRSLLSTSDASLIRVSHLFNWQPGVIYLFISGNSSWCNNVSASLLLQAFTPKEIIGFSIGSVSSVLYLFSRLPQMYTNVSMTSGFCYKRVVSSVVLPAYYQW